MAIDHVAFDLVLDKELKGTSELKNPVCHFHYNWDTDTNMGLATLQTINGTPVNITLHPLGIEGQLDFMSDMEPTVYSVAASEAMPNVMVKVVIYRVILDVDGAKKTAAIMFGEDGGTILTSDGFMEDSAAKQLPEIEYEPQDAPEGAVPPTAE